MTPARRARPARGFMLLEVLIAILIFSIGVLGIVGLQASMTKAQTGSKFRADATYLAQKLIGTLWVDRTNLAAYNSANCASNTRCNQWLGEVARALPAGTAALTVTPQALEADGTQSALVTVIVSWTPPNEEQHSYTTNTIVSSRRP